MLEVESIGQRMADRRLVKNFINAKQETTRRRFLDDDTSTIKEDF